jgi:addiction module RelE/StbE family toxin
VRLRYTLPAARNLEKTLADLAQQSPQGAKHVQERIQALTSILLNHPEIGRTTNRPGMRRIVVFPYPYLIFYRALNDEVIIHAVRHAARKPL